VDLSAPISDVVPGVRGALFGVLCRLEQPVTRRRLAELAGVAPGHASKVVEDLIISGLVDETIAGRSSMVALNRGHLAVPAVMALAGIRGELIRRLRARFAEMREVRGAWLFGSVARGDSGSDSDVDVLVIADGLDTSCFGDQVARLYADVRAWTGNDLQLVEHTQESWDRLVGAKNPLATEIRRDGILLTQSEAVLTGRPA